MKILVTILLFIFGLFMFEPPYTVSIKGKVFSENKKDALSNCTVRLIGKSGLILETKTDSAGNYLLDAVESEFSILLSKKGFKNYRIDRSFDLKKDTFLNFTSYLSAINATIMDSVIANIHEMDERGIKSKTKYLDVYPAEDKADRKEAYKEIKLTGGTMRYSSYSSEPGIKHHSYAATRGAESFSGERVRYGSSSDNFKAGSLTAGEINDFNKWLLWNDISNGELRTYVSHWTMLPKNRFSVQLVNKNNLPVSNAKVVLEDKSGNLLWESVSDNTGKAELWSGLFDTLALDQTNFKIRVSYQGSTFRIRNAKLFSKGINTLNIPVSCGASDNVDIAFAVDATGSMGDEIKYLQVELYDVIQKIKERNNNINLNLASVFYRDHNDAFLTVQQDFTNNLDSVMEFIKRQSADGGGDEPEAVEEALKVAIGQFSWRSDARTRILFLVLDAAPHRDAESVNKIKKYTQLAAKKGIRIIPIVCSGIDKSGEFLMRSIALASNGNYIYLTDDSGIGSGHIKPSTDKIEVEKLNELLLKTIQRYIFIPDCKITEQELTNKMNETTDRDTSSDDMHKTETKLQPELLKYYPNPCKGILKIDMVKEVTLVYLTDLNGKIIMNIPLSREQGTIEVNLDAFPSGIYYLRYKIGNKFKSGKFVLIH